jgi:hypothetical protein
MRFANPNRRSFPDLEEQILRQLWGNALDSGHPILCVFATLEVLYTFSFFSFPRGCGTPQLCFNSASLQQSATGIAQLQLSLTL